MAKYEATLEQQLAAEKAAHEVLRQVGLGGLNPVTTIDALKKIRHVKGGDPSVLFATDPAATKEPRLYKRNGAYHLKTTRRGLTDDHIVADFKAAGWGYINPSIRADRRLDVPGKPEIEVGTERKLKIASVVPESEAWKFQKVVDAIGTPALAFDLEDLRNLVLGHEDELLKRGIRWIVAPVARFRSDGGSECVVYASLGSRKLRLFWVERDWSSLVWFGSSK
jgi:hypothetical protein